MKLEWTNRPGTTGMRWFAQTPAGEISVRQRSFRNVGTGWEVTFPNGKTYRAGTSDLAKSYAEENHERVAAR